MKPLRTKTKRLLALALTALLLAVAVASLYHEPAPTTWKQVLPEPEHTKVDRNDPLREQTRVVEISGRTFEIPIMYFDTALDPGTKQDDLLLEVIWPEMRSSYELKDKAEYDRMRKEEHRLGWILLELASFRPPLDTQVSNMQTSMMKYEHVGVEEGLDKYLWYRGTPEQPKLQHEAYIERNDQNQVVTYIDCFLGPSVRFPGCTHKFIDQGLIYQISYNKAAFFSQWREQRQRAIALMRGFEIKTTTQQAQQ